MDYFLAFLNLRTRDKHISIDAKLESRFLIVCNNSEKSQVIGKMRMMMAEDSINMPNNSFLLDVDSR